jgi:hypothetical protein
MKPLILAGVAAAAVLAAGCGPATSSGNGSAAAPPASSQPSEQPLGSSWQLGGAYTGPIPPVQGLPSPAGGVRFASSTDSKGYTEQVTVRVGAPLHFNIPQVLEDCYTAYPDQRSDLDPGMYVIPIQTVTTNHTNQEAPAWDPAISAENADGNPVPMTDVLHMTLASGSCRMDYYTTLHVGGSTTLTGYVGPATASDLAGTWLRINGKRYKLTTLEPHRTAAWLIAHS